MVATPRGAVQRTPRGPAYEPWRTWRDGSGPHAAVAAAVLAANPRNVQPWLFEIEDGRIGVRADLSRDEGALDPYHRELQVGLGCALENLVLAARANGLDPRVTIPEPVLEAAPDAAAGSREAAAGSRETLVADVLLPPAEPEESELYHAIPYRRTNRGPFRRRPVPADLLEEMSQLGTDDLSEMELRWFTTAGERRQVGDLLVAATEAIIADDEQSRAGYGWFRKTRREITEHRDGTTVDTHGLPPPVSAVGRVMPRQSRRAADQFWLRRTRAVHTATAAAYGIVTVPDATRLADRVRGGQLLQRVHLFATARGVAVGHLNMMTVRADRERQTGSEPRFTEALADLVGSPGRRALALFRVGYAARPAGVSPRRPVAAVLAGRPDPHRSKGSTRT